MALLVGNFDALSGLHAADPHLVVDDFAGAADGLVPGCLGVRQHNLQRTRPAAAAILIMKIKTRHGGKNAPRIGELPLKEGERAANVDLWLRPEALFEVAARGGGIAGAVKKKAVPKSGL